MSQGKIKKRLIDCIILHCSDTPKGMDIGVKEIDRWHKERGWKSCGYHYVIRLDGTIEKGRDEEEIGAHCISHNQYSIGICYVGGRDGDEYKDTRTQQQKEALNKLIEDIRYRRGNIPVYGHYIFSKGKKCPCITQEEIDKEFNYK